MKKIILSAGGTGGHLYPAVATAEKLKETLGEDVELLFVGAEGKMEMEKIPALGYNIVGLPVAGLQRKLTLSNLALPFKVIKSLLKARKIIKEFGADAVAGFGGYASAPVLFMAQKMGIPTILQEQNSYAGLTNKILAKGANKICVAYNNMDKFFKKEKITLTGNPLRGSFSGSNISRATASQYFSLAENKPTILILGGSLGCRTLNNMMKNFICENENFGDYQIIWQTGKFYEKEMNDFVKQHNCKDLWNGAFIDRMDYAYAAADIVISRSGACTVSELSLVGKATIFVPSPNVAEDHQTKNARALSDIGAAMTVPDAKANEAMKIAIEMLGERKKIEELEKNILKLAIKDSAQRVANVIIKQIK